MATRNNSAPVIDNSSEFSVYTWTGLLNGDVGDAVICGGFAIASIEWEGTPGAGFAGAIEVSNNAGSARPEVATSVDQWTAISGLAASAVGMVQNLNGINWAAVVRPHVTAGDGTTSMTCRILLVK